MSTAQVKVTLKLSYPSSTWSADTTLAQVRKQALAEAQHNLNRLAEVAQELGLKISIVEINKSIDITIGE